MKLFPLYIYQMFRYTLEDTKIYNDSFGSEVIIMKRLKSS